MTFLLESIDGFLNIRKRKPGPLILIPGFPSLGATGERNKASGRGASMCALRRSDTPYKFVYTFRNSIVCEIFCDYQDGYTFPEVYVSLISGIYMKDHQGFVRFFIGGIGAGRTNSTYTPRKLQNLSENIPRLTLPHVSVFSGLQYDIPFRSDIRICGGKFNICGICAIGDVNFAYRVRCNLCGAVCEICTTGMRNLCTRGT